MRTTVGWLECRRCAHLVNPRSECCDEPHELCTGEGCRPYGVVEGDVPGPLEGVSQARVARLAALDGRRAAGGAQTTYMVDIASYQAGINLATVRAAGFSKVNIKTSQGTWYTFGSAVTYARAAAALGMGVSAFHWLDNSASGTQQARYCWNTLKPVIDAVGHPVALQCDNEDSARPASWQITADFVVEATRLMGHRPYMYSGDWWATAGGRAGWNVAGLTPWLMAAPNAGYLGTYPGDTSSHWRAGYWGYGDLALMQYAVSSIAGAGGGSISKTAIRDPGVWAALTGGADDMSQQAESILANLAYGVDHWTDNNGKVQPLVPVMDIVRQIEWREAITKRLDTIAQSVAAVQSPGAPSQDQVDAAVRKALADPAIVKGIGDAFAAHLHVS